LVFDDWFPRILRVNLFHSSNQNSTFHLSANMGVKTRWSPNWDALSEWNLTPRLWNTVRETWYLGFTSFGGPPVHFKIVCLLSISVSVMVFGTSS